MERVQAVRGCRFTFGRCDVLRYQRDQVVTNRSALQSDQIRLCEAMLIIGLILLDRRVCRVMSGIPG